MVAFVSILLYYCTWRSVNIFCYPPGAVFDPYRGIYKVGYILFVYNCASVTWVTTVNNIRFLPNISETM